MQKRDSLLRAIVCITNFTLWLVTQPFPDNLLGRGGGGGVCGRLRTISGNGEVEEKGKGKNTKKQKQNKSLLVFFSES